MPETPKAASKEAMAVVHRLHASCGHGKGEACAFDADLAPIAREFDAFAAERIAKTFGDKFKEAGLELASQLIADRDALRERNRALVAAMKLAIDQLSQHYVNRYKARIILGAALAADAKAGEDAGG